MNFWKKFKEVSLCLLPIIVIVLLIHTFVYRFEADLLIRFLFSAVLIMVGEVLFLTGTDNSIMPMGEIVGNSSNTLKHVSVLVFFAFVFGVFATIAEPDVNVLASEISVLGLSINKTAFIFIIGAGVGVFVALGLIRILTRFSYKAVMIIILAICFIVAMFVPNTLLAVAFDAGGATTGIIASPFLLAISAGISKSRSSKTSRSDNFGMIGITSLGPVLAILFLSLFLSVNNQGAELSPVQVDLLLDTLISCVTALLPLLLVFFIFDMLFINLPRRKKVSLAFGSFVTFAGLYLFLFGINYGFLEMGEAVGEALGAAPTWLFFLVCLVVGFVVTFTEPAVRVLGGQVEDITQGNITRKGVTIAIAISMMLAVVLSGLKILFNINIMYILAIGYAIVVILMMITPTTFVAISFDSGGVASGPMTAAFVLPLMLGVASALGDASAGFGLIAIVGMMPIIVIEALGVIYKVKIMAKDKAKYRVALRIAYGANAYSNMDKLEEKYNKLQSSTEDY